MKNLNLLVLRHSYVQKDVALEDTQVAGARNEH